MTQRNCIALRHCVVTSLSTTRVAALRASVEEVEEDRRQNRGGSGGGDGGVAEGVGGGRGKGGGNVLLACKDERMCLQLNTLINKGAKQVGGRALVDGWRGAVVLLHFVHIILYCCYTSSVYICIHLRFFSFLFSM